MSTLAVAWALNAIGLTPTQKLVLILLADHYNQEKGCAFMGQKRLAAFTGLSREAVNRNLKALEADGWFVSEAQQREEGGAAPNHYALCFGRAPIAVGKHALGEQAPADHVTQDHRGGVTQDHRGGVTQDHRNLERALNLEEDQKTSSAEPTDQPKRDIEELVARWNEHCGELAKTRVVSREVEAKLRALRKRHGDALDQLFLDGIAAVRTDTFWLGTKASDRKRREGREGPPYGLVNYLRHIEDKANQAMDERAEAEDVAFPDAFAVGQSWWTREHGAVVVVGVASDRKQAKVRVVRAKADGPGVGATALIAPADLKNQRHVDVTV